MNINTGSFYSGSKITTSHNLNRDKRSGIYWLKLICLTMLLTSPISGISAESTKTILFIDSYHKGYAWSDGILSGIQKQLAGKGVKLHIHHMDTKRRSKPDQIAAAAKQAITVIRKTKPEVVIACDDNAAKGVIAPYPDRSQAF